MRGIRERFQRRLRLAWRWLALPAALAWLSACGGDASLLNSDRIEERYGSYGVEIIDSDARGRRSNLYSVHDGQRICRTYAVVRFLAGATAGDEPALRAAHARVLDGASIGATLREAGFTVHKRSLAAGALPLPVTEPAWGRLMGLSSVAGLAVYEYRLSINKGSQSIDYAEITEVYHPDYLRPADVYAIAPDAAGLDDAAIPDDVLVQLGLTAG